jgi:glycosyltransferase involved in cell wall biosynthesis
MGAGSAKRGGGLKAVAGRAAGVSMNSATLPLVSVVVPTYNYEQFIGRTLESVQSQTYEHWECVVVDDGSTDDTAGVVARYAEGDGRIRYVRQRNQRQGAAKNNGIRHGRGEYLQFLDADDLIEPRKLERQVEFLERHRDVDIVYGGVRFFLTEDMGARLHSMWGDDRPWMPGVSGAGEEVLRALTRANIMAINSPLVRRAVVDAVGDFDERLPPAEDWDYWIRCAAAGARFRHEEMEGTLALVRSHPLSSSKDKRSWLSASLLMRKKLARRLADPEARRLNAALLAENEGLLGVEEVLHGSLARGVCRMLKAGVTDRKLNHKAKWLFSALSAPFVSRERFGKIYSTSIKGAVRGGLRKSEQNPSGG